MPEPTSSDRRRDYERRHRAMGLCQRCASKALPGDDRCLRHCIFYMLGQAKLTRGVLSEKAKHRREVLVAHLQGRYSAIRAGHLEPTPPDKLEAEADAIRKRLKIRWAGDRGVGKLASVLRRVESRALRARET